MDYQTDHTKTPHDGPEPSLGMTAGDFYNEERGNRQGVVDIGRRLADYTIPSLFPPENYDTSHDSLAITNQSIGAFLVNGLMNTLQLTALPPDLPMAKIEADDPQIREETAADPKKKAALDYGLMQLEQAHRRRINRTNARSAYTQAMGLLAVPGNVLTMWKNIDTAQNYNLHTWVCKRDAGGWPLVTVLRDEVNLAVVDEDVREAIMKVRDEQGGMPNKKPLWQDTGVIYHVQKWCKEENEWLYWQECEGGYVIPGTDFWSPKETPCMYPGTLILETGSNYGLGYASLYEGDLQTMEELSASFKDTAAALAWFLTFVDPTGMTNIRDVRKADNLAVLPGRAADVTAYISGKSGDASFLDGALEKIARRLGQAFANKTAIQRSGERVTREEWVIMVQALQEAMGGLHAIIAYSYQRWFIKRFIYLHREEDPKIAKVPSKYLNIDVVTGLDAIGQSADYESVMGIFKDMGEIFTPQVVGAKANFEEVLKRLAAGKAVQVDGLTKTPEETQQEEQKAQQAALMEKGVGPAVQGGLDLMKQGMVGNQQQQQAEAPQGA